MPDRSRSRKKVQPIQYLAATWFPPPLVLLLRSWFLTPAIAVCIVVVARSSWLWFRLFFFKIANHQLRRLHILAVVPEGKGVEDDISLPPRTPLPSPLKKTHQPSAGYCTCYLLLGYYTYIEVFSARNLTVFLFKMSFIITRYLLCVLSFTYSRSFMHIISVICYQELLN
jgi:hypothetical protein